MLFFSEDGKTGSFVIGEEHFPASLLNLPCIVESYKTYDDNVLIKSADIGQVGLGLIFLFPFSYMNMIFQSSLFLECKLC